MAPLRRHHLHHGEVGQQGRVAVTGRETQSVLLCGMVDGRNPAPVDVINIIFFYRFFYISGGAGFLPSTVCFWKK